MKEKLQVKTIHRKTGNMDYSQQQEAKQQKQIRKDKLDYEESFRLRFDELTIREREECNDAKFVLEDENYLHLLQKQFKIYFLTNSQDLQQAKCLAISDELIELLQYQATDLLYRPITSFIKQGKQSNSDDLQKVNSKVQEYLQSNFEDSDTQYDIYYIRIRNKYQEDFPSDEKQLVQINIGIKYLLPNLGTQTLLQDFQQQKQQSVFLNLILDNDLQTFMEAMNREQDSVNSLSYTSVQVINKLPYITYTSQKFSQQSQIPIIQNKFCNFGSLFGLDSDKHKLHHLHSSLYTRNEFNNAITQYKQDGTPWCCYVCSFSFKLKVPLKLGQKDSYIVQLSLQIYKDITQTKNRKIGKYILGRALGRGASGIVRYAKYQEELFAIKSIDGKHFSSLRQIDQIQDEIKVLSTLKHPNIIELHEVLFINEIFYFVMDLAQKGSLVNYTRSYMDRKLPELEAQRIFVQMISAVEYCHRKRIIHRDLKPENILMDDNNNIKIADFGLSAIVQPHDTNLNVMVGTPQFAAPELLARKEYDGRQIDIWSMGVILYELIQGFLPFNGTGVDELRRLTSRGVYQPLSEDVASNELSDLIRRMLIVDPIMRINLDEIKRHSWLRQGVDNTYSQTGRFSETQRSITDSIRHKNTFSQGLTMQRQRTTTEDDNEISGELLSETQNNLPEIHESLKLVIPQNLKTGKRDDFTK